ncbi:chemotaxis protein CheA [Cohnella boryungensis]|uniref:chemotaxis protein CheA n=1 Tax=Cohnella boryungensis TaxID=768479 RepID=UPI003671416F
MTEDLAETIRPVHENKIDLDEIMKLAEDLVVGQNRLHQLSQKLKMRMAEETTEELGQIAEHLTYVIHGLQESVLKAKRLPIATILDDLPLLAEECSRDLGKEVSLRIEGENTQLDRDILEAIAEPLRELVRNAIKHGIERPETRQGQGKRREGTLRITADREDNQVVIRVKDDGVGIDTKSVIRLALSRSLTTSEEAASMTDREAAELVLHPGYHRGEGGGLKAVRTRVESVQGLIDIDTAPGQGTSFRIQLPQTLELLFGVLVLLGRHIYIIPRSAISEIVEADYSDIRSQDGRQMYPLQHRNLPIVWLHAQYRIPRVVKATEKVPLVIVGSAERRVALAVDEVLWSQDVRMRLLGSYIGKSEGVAGMAILSGGKPAMIVDVAAITALHAGRSDRTDAR